MRLRLFSLLAVLAVAIPTAALASRGKGEVELEAYLSGKVEVPKGDPNGKGTVSVKIDGSQVCWSFTGVKSIDKAVAAHIHKAPAGKSGDVVVAFFAGAYKAKGCVTAKRALAAAVAAKPKAYYVNLHTVKYPAGAIRGQLHVED